MVLHTACGSGWFCSAGDKLGRLRGANGSCGWLLCCGWLAGGAPMMILYCGGDDGSSMVNFMFGHGQQMVWMKREVNYVAGSVRT